MQRLDYSNTDNLLELLERRLSRVFPRSLGGERQQAGVLVALTDDPLDPQVVLTQRADSLSSHGGEVAFPGGKKDATDSSLEQTALREAEEEIGLPHGQVRIISQLGQVVSKYDLLVTPFVGVIPSQLRLEPNPDELHSVFKVPLRFFLQDLRLRTDHLNYKGRELFVPSYRYQGYTIWGLTAYILVEMLNLGLGARIPMRPRPEINNERVRHDIPR